MAQVKMNMGLVLVLLGLLCAGAMAQTSCDNVLVNLSPCVDYLTGNSSKPTSGCCTQLASVVKSQPECLCQGLQGGGSQFGLKVNQTQALALPSACKVQTPPAEQCKTGTKSVSNGGNSVKITFHVPLMFVVFVATYICFNFQDILTY